jgi:hypothetical protein
VPVATAVVSVCVVAAVVVVLAAVVPVAPLAATGFCLLLLLVFQPL